MFLSPPPPGWPPEPPWSRQVRLLFGSFPDWAEGWTSHRSRVPPLHLMSVPQQALRAQTQHVPSVRCGPRPRCPLPDLCASWRLSIVAHEKSLLSVELAAPPGFLADPSEHVGARWRQPAAPSWRTGISSGLGAAQPPTRPQPLQP